MANYSGDRFGNQAVNVSYKTDLISRHQNTLYHNIFNGGVVGNYMNVCVSNKDGICSLRQNETLITWNNSEFGEIPLETNIYVKIELYRGTELFYLIDIEANNSGEYLWIFPTDFEIAGLYKLKITGITDNSYYYEDKVY